MSSIRGVILDVDGTLVDSNDAHTQAWVTAFSEHGYKVDFDKVRHLVGMGGDNLLPETIHVEKDSPEGKALSKRYMELFKEKITSLKAFPQTRALVTKMQARGLHVVIGSSSQTEVLDQLLEIAGVKDLVEESVSSKDAKHSKPDPDTVQVALKKLNLPPEETIMLGDTPYDITAAEKAGVKTIAVRCGGFTESDLKGAAAIYADPADLLAHFDQSPLAES